MNDHLLSKRRRGGRTLIAVVLLMTLAAVGATGSTAAGSGDGRRGSKPTVVLVHGAFADASGWNDVTGKLHCDGYTVLATANPLRGVDSDAACLRSILDTLDGPIVLVGHSYGGFGTANAATGDPDVKALVYVAAFAPAAGDTVERLTALNPGSGLADPANLIVRPHPSGADGYINPATLPRDLRRRPAAPDHRRDGGQPTPRRCRHAVPTIGPARLGENIPSWYVVAAEDHTIPPATQRVMAQRTGATTVEVRASHVAMMSQPNKVAAVIEQAATSVD